MIAPRSSKASRCSRPPLRVPKRAPARHPLPPLGAPLPDNRHAHMPKAQSCSASTAAGGSQTSSPHHTQRTVVDTRCSFARGPNQSWSPALPRPLPSLAPTPAPPIATNYKGRLHFPAPRAPRSASPVRLGKLPKCRHHALASIFFQGSPPSLSICS